MIKKFEVLIEDAIKDGAFPGACYCIVTKNKSYFGTLGDRAWFPSKETNDLNTIYDMASLTKVIATTSMVMTLVEKGNLRLYASVSKYLPRFKHTNVTIWDLLTHTSGLPADVGRSRDILSSDELMEKIYAMDLINPRNTKIVYSDIGFILLGKVIEVVSKEKLDDYASKTLFTPLEMNNSGYNPRDIKLVAPTEERNDRVVQRLLRGHVHDEKAYILGGIAGHAGLFSTVHDVANFIKMILNQGMFKGKKILSKATVDLLYQPKVETKEGNVLKYEQRGIGWIVQSSYSSAGDLVSDETILHTGFTGTNLWIDRKNEVGFCLLTNRVHPTRDNLKIIDVRPRLANFIMANLDEFTKEENLK